MRVFNRLCLNFAFEKKVLFLRNKFTVDKQNMEIEKMMNVTLQTETNANNFRFHSRINGNL